ncbi:Histidine biosynthesis trifunctional protein [Erysiphe neolycopersici]|uniref:Histidine biosynthesis trifunctional protein n=1 Tax=Erysiphe neolycopersici TaxID=212602 RepID=A0A420HJ00_9PEZI|nr:Histidine biosynthesis trifunctional protein [Erysiphe neolycopersici]
METILSIPLLPSVHLANPPSDTCPNLNSQQLSILGCAYFNVTDTNVQEFFLYMENNVNIQPYVDVRSISSIDVVIEILDVGAIKIFVTSTQRKALEIHSDRLILIYAEHEPLPNKLETKGILIDIPDDPSTVDTHLKILKEQNISPIYITTNSNLNSYVALAKKYLSVPIISTSSLSISFDSQEKISIPKYLATVWKSDREDKLVTTIVTDVRGNTLGLVYSNEASVKESLRTATGVYYSRKRGLWHKGATSGDTQHLVRIYLDCDMDCLKFVVHQNGSGFCHLPQSTCFGNLHGIAKLESTLISRQKSAPESSYTARLFSDEKLLKAKIMEEAEELCEANTKDHVASEAADLIFFILTKAIKSGVTLTDIERNLDAKSLKTRRRPGNAKGKWARMAGITNDLGHKNDNTVTDEKLDSCTKSDNLVGQKIAMKRLYTATLSPEAIRAAIKRPSQLSSTKVMDIVMPIIKSVQEEGDEALLRYTHKFEKATSLTSPVINAPFNPSLMKLPVETIKAIDVSFNNIEKFHRAQKDNGPLNVETMPGVKCSRFARPIERVGLYVPGGTAVLPSTALMLGVPAMVAGCKKIIIATPPRLDGSISPEIVYIANKIGANSIVLAGGAQAIAALAYGTNSVCKVDKILGPGNQFVTAAKMYVSNDTNASVSIDMPAGPSEVLVIADKTANPAFVASDLLSQAEHGVDSQVILIAVDLSDDELKDIENELHMQATALPRIDIIRKSIDHSLTLIVRDIEEAIELSNDYAPEHLILQVANAEKFISMVTNAGSIFIGDWTPESVGDYSSGVNHSLPTYGYAKQYSGVNLSSFTKHITSSYLSAEGLRNLGPTVMQLCKVEELEGHRHAVDIRLNYMKLNGL